ncbi:MAG: DinB family protein [Bacteroidota bacterium]|nr:DinB family protein [Bacteroidota bacterium]
MKQLLEQYARYNFWANKILLEKLAQIPKEILYKEMGGSFPSIFLTLVHLMDVESIWWQRLLLLEHVQWPGKNIGENFDELSKQLMSLSKQWSDWVTETNEKNIIHVFGYQNSKKEFFKQPVYEMMLHLFNHQTYHRGQIVMMLRQNNIDKIPATDFIVFSRKNPLSKRG